MRSVALLSALLFWSSISSASPCPAVPDLTISWVGTMTGCSGPVPCAATEPITFSAKATNGSFATCHVFDWNFGDNSAHSSSRTPTHAFVSLGTFSVVLTVSNGNGLSNVGGGVVTVATLLPSVVDFRATPNRVEMGGRVVFSWDTKNSRGVRIDSFYGQPFPLAGGGSVGKYVFYPQKSTAYTLTALGDAAQSPPTTITVEVNAPQKRRPVKH